MWKDQKKVEEFMNFTFSDYMRKSWFVEDQPFGSYTQFYDKMWTAAKSHPSMLIVYFEDMKKVSSATLNKLQQGAQLSFSILYMQQ